MSNKPDANATPTPPKKETNISKADELVKGSDAELTEQELERASGGGLAYGSVEVKYIPQKDN